MQWIFCERKRTLAAGRFSFGKGASKQLFVCFSFVAGKELVKYIVSVLNIALGMVIGKWVNMLAIQGKIVASSQVKMLSHVTTGILFLATAILYARVWQMRRGDFGKELKKKLNDRRCGYIGCLDYSLDIKGIQEWCLKMELSEYQKKHKIQEYEAFKHITGVFMQKVSDLEFVPEIYYSSQLGQIVYREGDMSMPVTNLSAGYQSLLWMVMDLAYRMALLNPEYVENVEKIPGVVLIDEIDMHLHPKWQWNIVKALEETFPKVQFILATHSPIVISSCKNEQLIMITEEQEVLYLDDAYGYSVQDVLNYRQGTIEKPKEMKLLASKFEIAMEEEDWNSVENIILKMENILGEDHPDVRSAKAELELNRWEA